MSIDTLIQLRTALSADQVRATLLHDRGIADLKLEDTEEENEISSEFVTLNVAPWGEDDHHLIGNGFQTGSVVVTVIPRRGPYKFEAEHRAIAAVLRLISGDICVANQDAAGPDLIRLGGVVYMNPDGFLPDSLTDFGYKPDRLVVGIPNDILVGLS